jgi:hypothetical protein
VLIARSDAVMELQVTTMFICDTSVANKQALLRALPHTAVVRMASGQGRPSLKRWVSPPQSSPTQLEEQGRSRFSRVVYVRVRITNPSTFPGS